MPHRFNGHDVLADLEGNPVILDTEALHIITGDGSGKLKRVWLGCAKGDLVQAALLEVTFEFFQLLFGGVCEVDVQEVQRKPNSFTTPRVTRCGRA